MEDEAQNDYGTQSLEPDIIYNQEVYILRLYVAG